MQVSLNRKTSRHWAESLSGQGECLEIPGMWSTTQLDAELLLLNRRNRQGAVSQQKESLPETSNFSLRIWKNLWKDAKEFVILVFIILPSAGALDSKSPPQKIRILTYGQKFRDHSWQTRHGEGLGINHLGSLMVWLWCHSEIQMVKS